MLRTSYPTRAARALLTLLLCAACVLPAAAQHKKTFKQQVAELESQWFEAQRTNDAATIDRLLSDDYIGINAQGMVSTKAQTLARIQTRQVVINKLDVEDQKITIHGDTAVVTSEVEVDATNSSTQPATHVHSKLRYTRIYLRYPSGTWRIVNFESTHISDMPSAAAPAPTTTKP